MGKAWDGGGIAFDPDTWRAVLRVLKPGGILLAFGGTRTYHRMACAVEDAGFEVRDCLMWMYGSGFPKSYDVSKGIDRVKGAKRERIRGVRSGVVKSTYAQDAWSKEFKDSVLSSAPITPEAALWTGYGSALKPAWEPIILAMKPLENGYAKNALKHGVAGLNVDGGRIDCADHPGVHKSMSNNLHEGYRRPWRDGGPPQYKETPSGRWPANVLLSHDPRCVQVGVATSPGYQINRFKDGAKPFGGGAGKEYGSERVPGGEVEVWACVPGCPVRMLDEQSGLAGHQGKPYVQPRDVAGGKIFDFGLHIPIHPDGIGGASRFFYTAKASTSERSAGLSPAERNIHPTVKPVDLMRYLIRLVTVPENTRILDPFMGSGSTLVAAKQLGVKCVGIDLEKESCRTAAARLSRRTSKGVGKRRGVKCRRRSRRKP